VKQIYPTIGAAIVCLALAACGSSPVEEEAPNTVEQSMQQLLNLDPASAQEVRVLLENGSYQEAFKAANGILVNKPGDPEASLLAGEALLRLGRPQEALPYFENAATAEAFRAEALQGSGIALYQSGKRDQAVGQLSQAVALNPALWRAYNALGSIYDSDSAWPQAEAAYQSALAVQPNSALLHNNLAMSYMLQHRYDEAVPEFNRALVLDPSLKTAQTNLRMAFAFNGRYLEALAGVPERDMPDALNNVGYAAMVRGDYDVAEAYFTQAMEMSPSYNSIAAANLDRLKAIRLTQSGDVDDAGVILQ
jgi:Flp pilus assembly protein TadD